MIRFAVVGVGANVFSMHAVRSRPTPPTRRAPIRSANLRSSRATCRSSSAAAIIRAIQANFIDAVERGAALVADGSEARMSLELANALIYSSAPSQQVSLPLDREAYAAFTERVSVVP